MFELASRDLDRFAAVKGLGRGRALIEGLLFDAGFQAVLLYRLAHWLRRHRVPAAGPAVARLSCWLTGADISPAAEIGPGFYIGHPVGLVVGGGCRVGAGAFFLQGTLGAPSQARLGEMPVLGDEVFLAAGARVVGGVRIGDRVFIGANAVVTSDVPDDSKVVSTAGVEIRTATAPRESRA